MALRNALAEDSNELLQGATTQPPPLRVTESWPVEQADPIGYCFWKAGLDTVGEVEEAWARCMFEVDQILGEPAGCRHLLNWIDETPRDRMRSDLLPEVDLAIARKKEQCHAG